MTFDEFLQEVKEVFGPDAKEVLTEFGKEFDNGRSLRCPRQYITKQEFVYPFEFIDELFSWNMTEKGGDYFYSIYRKLGGWERTTFNWRYFND